MPISHLSYLFLLRACNRVRSFTYTTHIYAYFTSFNRSRNGSFGNCLVATRTTCGAVRHEHEKSLAKAGFSCSPPISSISTCDADCGRGEETLCFHQHVHREDVAPSVRMFITLFKACGSIRDLAQGRMLHAEARKKGFLSDIYVSNTILSMYEKRGAVAEAEDAFSMLPKRTIVSWNVILAVYAQVCQVEKVFWSYRQMHEEGLSPDVRTLVLILQACGKLQGMQEALLLEKHSIKKASLEIGQAFHAVAFKKGLARNSFIGNTLVSLYGKCGAVTDASTAFESLPIRSVVSWTAMLSTFVENNQGEMALHCYMRMQEEGLRPDKVACTVAFQACSAMAEEEEILLVKERSIKFKAFKIGEALHADACKMSITSDRYVGTSVISMYGKCGAIAEAEEAFHVLPYRDVVSWNAMLSVYAEQGDGQNVLCLYNQMQKQSLPVDDVTLIYALQACGEHGSLEVCEGLHFHIVCSVQGKRSSLLATLIHAYGNCGCMHGMQATFSELNDPDLISWSVIISGYVGEGNDAMSFQLFERLTMASVSPDDIIFASILTACSHAGLVLEGLEYFESMTQDYQLAPKLMHYGAMTDLLGRVGEFNRVCAMLNKMPMQADLAIWWFLLGACRTHGNLNLAEEAFDHAINLQPKQATAYILLSYIYSAACLPDRVKEVEKLRDKQGLHGWTELD